MQQLSLCHWSPPAPPAPLGLGAPGVSLFLHPRAGGSHAFKSTKLLKVTTFAHSYKRTHYSFEHSSFYSLALSQSPWGVDQHLSKIWPPRTCLGALREKSLISGPTCVCATIVTLPLLTPCTTCPLGAGGSRGEPFSASLGQASKSDHF